ncbi:MAG: hypothetical protein JRI72_15020 [Deltaproteobacteria bacterium]|nr:hypothetical protein [Deltaproteobacteria bacterium]
MRRKSLSVNQKNQNRITEIVTLILEEAEQRKSKVGLVADIYAVSMEVDRQIIEVMSELKQKKV